MRGLPALFPFVMKRIPFLFASPEKGASTTIHVASSPNVAGLSARFFLKGREMATNPVTRDRNLAVRLWKISEDLCKLK